jgi:hypothetical protein
MIQQPDRQDELAQLKLQLAALQGRFQELEVCQRHVYQPSTQPNVTSRRRMIERLGIAAAGLVGIGGAAGAIPNVVNAEGRPLSTDSMVVGANMLLAGPTIKFNGPVDAPKYMRNGRDLEGTAFPTGPAVGDRFFRTDRGIEYYWDGNLWLSLQPIYTTMGYSPGVSQPLASSFGNYQLMGRPEDVYSMYVEVIILPAVVYTTLNASNYWQFQFKRWHENLTATFIANPISLYQAGRLPGQLYMNTLPFNTVYNLNDMRSMSLDWTKIGNPGTLVDHPALLRYRLVG